MSFSLPFTGLSLLHNHFTHLVSTSDDKFDFVDSNRIPYAIKYNKEIANYFTVADENGFIKIFTTHPKLKLIKEFSAQKSCIYDLQWLNSHEIACGGGDQNVSIYDINTCTRLALLKGHTESVKSITIIPNNPFVIATGSRDGSVLIFDTRFNRHIDNTTTDPNSESVSNIKAVNSIQPAHFIDNNPIASNNSLSTSSSHKIGRRPNSHANVLRSKYNQTDAYQSINKSLILKRPSPVACVSFQNEHLVVSAGATDGLIKVWDIRKIYSGSSVKKHIEPLPIYVFDNQLRNKSASTSPLKLASKGYSNLMFNTSRTRLYANCLNGQLYEYNFSTYNQNHTRSLSSCNKVDENNKPKFSYHTNQSNFIKSSLSLCENFILTGSSDFNAYIYSTNLNSSCDEFKKQMPVIVLKGHTNEVTTVDWNPFDSNQLITCSDDNTMRVWNVKRDMDRLKSNECNFSMAETIADDVCSNSSIKFNSVLRNFNRFYNKYMPNITGLHDDHVFVNFEYKNFIQQKREQTNFKENEMLVDNDFNDLEKELCIKCQNISIDNNDRSSSNSPVSQNIKSIENELIGFKQINDFSFINLETPLSSLPINIIPPSDPCIESTSSNEKSNDNSMKRQQSSSALIASANSFSLLLNESKTKSLKKRTKDKTVLNPQTKLKANETTCSATGTPLRMISKNAISTSKKRSWDFDSVSNKSSINGITDVSKLDEPKTPKIKRRLIMEENNIQSQSPSTSSKASKTILHYFSPVIQPK